LAKSARASLRLYLPSSTTEASARMDGVESIISIMRFLAKEETKERENPIDVPASEENTPVHSTKVVSSVVTE